jgi:hypothetical protein
MSDQSRIHPVGTDSPDGAAPAPVPTSRHLLTAWFGLVAIGGVAFGLFAHEQPFGRGGLAHPLVVFFAAILAGLLILRFLSTRPLAELISRWYVGAGIGIGVVCFYLGNWFGINLAGL